MNVDLTQECPALRSQSEKQARGKSRIPVKCRQRNRFIPGFLIGVAALSVLSLLYLKIDWAKMLSRVPDIDLVFWDLAHLDFSNMDLIFSSLVETISIAVLSLLYSLVLGVVFGMFAARNVFRIPLLSVATQSFFTFLRAVPTPVWVLLMLVCLGMGPEAGVAGLCVHTTGFFHQILCPELREHTGRNHWGFGGCRRSSLSTRCCPQLCPRLWPGPECVWRPTSPSAPFWVR